MALKTDFKKKISKQLSKKYDLYTSEVEVLFDNILYEIIIELKAQLNKNGTVNIPNFGTFSLKEFNYKVKEIQADKIYFKKSRRWNNDKKEIKNKNCSETIESKA